MDVFHQGPRLMCAFWHISIYYMSGMWLLPIDSTTLSHTHTCLYPMAIPRKYHAMLCQSTYIHANRASLTHSQFAARTLYVRASRLTVRGRGRGVRVNLGVVVGTAGRLCTPDHGYHAIALACGFFLTREDAWLAGLGLALAGEALFLHLCI